MAGIKRQLYLTHRWLGIALCLFMAMWFLSGVVMMYVGYPKLTPAERLQRLPVLNLTGCCVGLDAAIKASGEASNPTGVRMAMVAARPWYVMSYERGRLVAIDARNGLRLDTVSAQAALDAASEFSGGWAARHLGVIEEDAWTHSRALDAHRPLHRIEVQDEETRWLYISSKTGEVVRDATVTERIWNWIGAWIHWLYPLRGGWLDRQHADIVIYSSLAACLLALSGVVVGLMRWRLRGHYGNASKSPYREWFMRWHHVLGLLFGLLTIAWILSGLLSMNPWKVFDAGRRPLEERAWAGAEIEGRHFDVDLQQQLNRLPRGFDARELEWRMFDGKAYLIAFNAEGHTRILPVMPTDAPLLMFPSNQLAEVGARLLPQARIDEQEILTAYDFYYYGRAPHTMLGPVVKRLPVLRLKFDDEQATWVHLDPYTATVVNRLDARQRVKRWLFALLHSWDWLPLLDRRPLWDVLMVVGSLGGFMVSCTGAVMAWRRLRPSRRKPALQLTDPGPRAAEQGR